MGERIIYCISEYYNLCRSNHRKMWSAIARLDDETIIEFGFDVADLKRAVAFGLGLDISQICNNAYCYACAWVENTGRSCIDCPIRRILGNGCGHNAYGQLVDLCVNYKQLDIAELPYYWAEYLETFKRLALEMANAW